MVLTQVKGVSSQRGLKPGGGQPPRWTQDGDEIPQRAWRCESGVRGLGEGRTAAGGDVHQEVMRVRAASEDEGLWSEGGGKTCDLQAALA